MGTFGEVEQEILEDVCKNNGVPSLLVSKLLHAEFEHQGMTKHSKVYPKIGKILSEEWRENLDEIITDLKEQKKEKKELE